MNLDRFNATQALTEARLYTVPCSIQRRSSSSKAIHGKYGNFMSFCCKISNAFCLNITSCDSTMSVMSVVFFLPILPHAILTIGSSFMKPQFLASKCRNLFCAMLFRQWSNSSQQTNAMHHHGKCRKMTCKSMNSLQTCT